MRRDEMAPMEASWDTTAPKMQQWGDSLTEIPEMLRKLLEETEARSPAATKSRNQR